MNMLSVHQGLPNRVVLQAIGAVTIRHSELEDTLRMLLRTFLQISAEEARLYFARIGPARLRERLEREVLRVFRGSDVLTRLRDLLMRCENISNRRNQWVHALYGVDINGQPLMRNDAGNWVDPPNPSI
jgi:hypothetical protein